MKNVEKRIWFAAFLVWVIAVTLTITLTFFGCDSPNEQPLEPAFNCSGVWASNLEVNNNFIQIFVQQTDDDSFSGEMYLFYNYIGSFDNGKILEDNYVSFSFESETYAGRADMGFQGKFYNVNGEWELRGLLSGRVFYQLGVVWIFEREAYKFKKEPMDYNFLRRK